MDAPKPCPRCEGRGYLDDGLSVHGIPQTKTCICQTIKDLVRNLNRGWKGLADAPAIAASPLMPFVSHNAFVTADDDTLRQHLRFVALRMGPWWNFLVRSDADLMTAWLSPASLLGKEILDPDSATVSTEKATLVDLIDPPDLLIIRLGVKSARNSAMGEVLVETIAHRAHVNKLTWVVDSPNKRFDPTHLAYSDDVAYTLNRWKRAVLNMGDEPVSHTHHVEAMPPLAPVTTHDTGTSMDPATTKRVQLPTPREKNRRTKPFSRFGAL